MSTHDCDRLTGGTFMLLLETARKRSHKRRDSVAGKSDGLNNQELLKALIRVFDPSYPDPAASTFGNNTSKYRACLLAQGTYLPFDQEDLVAKFDYEIQSEYGAPLARMGEFVDRFIDVDLKSQQLVSALIGLILADCTIDDQQELFVTANGQSRRKAELTDVAEVELEGLLLGAWHYIVTKVSDNTVGRATFKSWNIEPVTPNSQWKLIPSALPSLGRNVSVVRSATPEQSKPEVTEDDGEIVEAEVVDDQDVKDEPTMPFTRVVEGASNSRITVFQGGTNNTNIAHVETLNLGGFS